MKIQKVCCFTGNSVENINYKIKKNSSVYINLKNEIIRLITECSVTRFITGMRNCADLCAAEIVLNLKNKYSNIELECVIPYETQAVHWDESKRDLYFKIIEHCDKETMLQTRFSNDCIQKMNKYMFGNSDYMVAVWNKKVSVIKNAPKKRILSA